MRTLKALIAGAAMAALATAASAASFYNPTGVQTNVSGSTVTGGGWTECFSQTYGAFGPSLSSVLSACGGTKLMLAARAVGSTDLLLLAQADRGDVTFDTGINGNVVHNANGVDWYFNPSYSWGFAHQGSGVFKTSCDASGVFNGNTSFGNERLCWHTGGGQMNGGWRAGNIAFLNSSSAYEKVIYTSNGGAGGVPEPAAWALMIGGFGFAGASLRRRRAATAA